MHPLSSCICWFLWQKSASAGSWTLWSLNHATWQMQRVAHCLVIGCHPSACLKAGRTVEDVPCGALSLAPTTRLKYPWWCWPPSDLAELSQFFDRMIVSQTDTYSCSWSCGLSNTCNRNKRQTVLWCHCKRYKAQLNYFYAFHPFFSFWLGLNVHWNYISAMIQQPKVPSSGLMPAINVLIRSKEVNSILEL